MAIDIAAYMTDLGSIDPWSSISVIAYTILAWVIFISLVLEVLIWVGCVALYITRHISSGKSQALDFARQYLPCQNNVALLWLL